MDRAVRVVRRLPTCPAKLRRERSTNERSAFQAIQNTVPGLALSAAPTDAAEAIERYVAYIAAAEDAIAPPPTLASLQQELGPHVSLTRVPRVDHALLPEQPARTAEALSRFARGVPAGAPAGPGAKQSLREEPDA